GDALQHGLAAVERVTVRPDRLIVSLRRLAEEKAPGEVFELSWSKPEPERAELIEATVPRTNNSEQPNQSVQLIIRAHAWLKLLTERRFESIEALAGSVDLHPKVVRHQIQLAFVSPNIAAEILSQE